jgi:hypothetical protein
LNGREGIVADASGRLTGSELISAMTEVNSPILTKTPILYTFFNFNDVTGVDISTSQVRDAADLSIRGSLYQSVSRVVAIYAKQDLVFALARMWQVFVNQTGWETQVFRERSGAVSWVQERVAATFGIEVALDADSLDARPSA